MPEKPTPPSTRELVIFYAKVAAMLIALGLFGLAMFWARRLRGA